jgi:exodeoxyribonuclease V beta subunit
LILAHAASWVARRIEEEQQRAQAIGFDGLLKGMDEALRGEAGEKLAAAIRQQLPAALVDEFQDTDPLQYRIFSATHRHADATLVLIGDPKQAIYAFRGADIFAYLEAKKAANAAYTLTANHRSAAEVVEAVNTLFSAAEQQEGGAFGFRQGEAENPVPFLPVEAKGKKARLAVGGQPLPALLWAFDEKLQPKGAYIAAMAERAAGQIAAWLSAGAGFALPDGGFLPLHEGDIAALVNDGKEAALLKGALARRGIRSVYLSEKDSVYASQEAAELFYILCAANEPESLPRIAAALATRTLNASHAELASLAQAGAASQGAAEARIGQFLRYRAIWQAHGALPMLHRLFFDFGVPARLLADPAHGARQLTDLLHLAELLNAQGKAQDGPAALIRFLGEAIASPPAGSEAHRIRLESDAKLVQIVTLHKSKGLEYPVVLLPFACAARPADPKKPLFWHDANGKLQLCLDAEAGSPAASAAEKERLGEDLRKLYVGLTRAASQLWVGAGSIAQKGRQGQSALAALLGLAPGDAEGFARRLAALAEAAPHCFGWASPPAPEAAPAAPAAPAAQAALAAANAAPPARVRTPSHPPFLPWRIHSFSGLAEGVSLPGLEDSPAGKAALEMQDEDESPAKAADEGEAFGADAPPEERLLAFAPLSPHAFPQGAKAGDLLHGILEELARTGFGACRKAPHAFAETIGRHCAKAPPEFDQPGLLARWLAQLIEAPLPLPGGGQARLCELSLSACRPEMEFLLPLRPGGRIEALDAAVRRHTLGGIDRPALAPGNLGGLLKGFVDLAFCHGGRYYVADYKSNKLGDSDAAYNRKALQGAIAAHRYDLQYALYLFALHRLLGARLPGYDYETHIGGAAYLFLRGVGAPGAGVFAEKPPYALIAELEEIFDGPC